ncbi:MAG: chemotaxis protein CheA [Rhodospirillales bacterium]|nr:chemotaxis protein CheA [Rhodospirillales bacterium]
MMDELLEQFLIEGRELVQQASDDLLALESQPSDPGRIDSAFRAVHTLKGSVALFDLAPMGKMLHCAEDMLGAVRAGHLPVTHVIIGTLLDCVTASDSWIESIERTGHLPADAAARSRSLQAAMASYLGEADYDNEARMSDAAPAWLSALIDCHHEAVTAARSAGDEITALRYVPSKDCFFLGDDPVALIRSIPALIALDIAEQEDWVIEQFNPFACNLYFEALCAMPIDKVRGIFRFVPDQTVIVNAGSKAVPAEPAGGGMSSDRTGDGAMRTLRVDAGRIDSLVDIVGELVVAKNGLAHLAQQAAATDAKLGRALAANQAKIDGLVGEMHRAIMSMRRVPLARTFQRFPRLMREIAGRLGKEISFKLVGEDVEADKSIIDSLFEPLLHILRNAADHGIEDVTGRRAAGKPPSGRITLEAMRGGDQIVIEVADDGAGIDLDKIRALAKTRSVKSESAIDALDDAAALELVFAPGFSTASAVTDMSGRGVGMDAVRTAIESMGGRVAVTSSRGVGSTVRMTLPQALVINTVITVYIGNERFGVPIDSVTETVRIAVDRIVPIRDGEAFVLRDRTIPLLRLSDLLGLARVERSGDVKLLIVISGEQRIGVEVGGFAERFDVLLRPLEGLLLGMRGVLGTAVLGDGHVLVVLNMAELIDERAFGG